MEEYMEVMRRTIDLSETCIECLEYINKQLNDGYLEDSLYLFESIVFGFYQIKLTIQILEFLPLINEVWDITRTVEASFNDILTGYEQTDINHVTYSLRNVLLPSFHQWRERFIQIFNPYILT